MTEGFHLRENPRIERRDALRAVHASDHVVEAARTKDDLERRCLIRRVERDEPLGDDDLAALQVVLREMELVPVLAQVALDLRQLLRRCVVLRPRALQRVGKLLQLPDRQLSLCALRRNRGVGKRRDCR
jgi:hypothetical protein